MQTILGSGGAIGTELAKELNTFTDDIRLVSRNPKKVNTTDHLFSADLLDYKQLEKAIEGSEIAYITVGFPYSYKVWQQAWPRFIENVLKACKERPTKLVFFDNIYMYDKDQLDGMTEDTTINPPSKKGQVRAAVFQSLMDEIDKGSIQGLVARAADFYGPSIKGTSLLTEMGFDPLSRGKKASWLMSTQYKHSFTYTPDAAKATAILGNTPSAYNQVWHLPTAKNPKIGKEWIESIAQKLGTKPKIQVANKFITQVLGLFNPIMKEFVEMLYQYDRTYVFNSDKFEKAFDFKPTPYEQGISEIIEQDYRE